MKPIRLSLKGLQSYREEQVIDFTQLIHFGVFGIFGPTGSGKSTILDAITLALYGNVERAGSTTQGIMNQAEESLNVSFTFCLQNQYQTLQYQVERQYRRKKDQSIEQRMARLIAEETGGKKVIAEGAMDVNHHIQSIIGLSMTDFTRAVVLPQGKFAEFLSLTGRNRRQMLQRLFHLESYGDGLAAKLSAKVKQTEARLNEIAAEQQGLGHASEQAVITAKKTFQQTEKLVNLRRKMTIIADQYYKTHSDIWKLQQRKHELELDRIQWIQQAEQIETWENSLDRYRQVQLIVPLWDDLQSLSARKRSAETQLQMLNEQKQTADADVQLLTDNKAKLAETYVEQERLTKEEIGNLKEALQIENSIVQLTEQLTLKVATEQQLNEKLQFLQQQIADTTHQVNNAENNCLEWQTKIDQLEWPLAKKRKWRHISEQYHQLKSLKSQFEREQIEFQTATKDYETKRLKEKALKERNNEAFDQLKEIFSHILILDDQLQQAKLIFEQKQLEQMREQKHIKEQLNQLSIEHQASELVHLLTEGEPCLLCGSTEHPHPYKKNNKKGQQLRAELELVNDRLQEIQHLKLENERGLYRSNALIDTLSTLLNIKADEFHSPNRSQLTYTENDWQMFKTSICSVYTEIDDGSPRWSEVKQQYEQLNQQCNLLTYELTREQTNLSELERKVTNSTQAIDFILQDWLKLDGTLTEDVVKTNLKQMSEAEELVELYEQQLKTESANLQFIREQMGCFKEELNELQMKKVQLTTQITTLNETKEEHEKKLYALVGQESNIQEVLLKTEQRLEELQSTWNSLSEQLDQAKSTYQKILHEWGIVSEQVRSFQEQVTEAKKRLDRQLESSPFHSIEALSEFVLTDDEVERRSEITQNYREHEQKWKIQYNDVLSRLRNQSITKEQWEAIQELHRTAKLLYEQTTAQLGRAERDYEDVARRHRQWSILQGQHVELSLEAERLNKLQTVFRGNAFIDFVAAEQLIQVSHVASERLGMLTNHRYALEVDSSGGFIIRDDANGGVRRPVSTLSGGETFLTSLALALALSAQIQLQGQFPLEFFFLDEGFGTLDSHLLDSVVTALEQLHMDRVSVGVISHVPELRARLPVKLIVTPAEPAGVGSRVSIEYL